MNTSSSSSLEPCTASTCAVLGPEGTFSFFTARAFFDRSGQPAPSLSMQDDLEQVILAVHQGRCTCGLIPMENSLHGTVTRSFDLLLRYPLQFQAEVVSRIGNCLLSRAENLADIHTVYSHAQPLGQCAGWLREQLPHAAQVAMASTAAAGHRAAAEPHSAAVGHGGLAELCGLNCLARGIEDSPDNWTRFVLAVRDQQATEPASAERLSAQWTANVASAAAPWRTSLLFTLPDAPGALAAVLQVLAREGRNLCHLESRPRRDSPWQYAFFARLDGSLAGEEHAGLCRELAGLCASFRVLGSYPQASCP